jgi:methanogenic corrinoid protein MtbC1
MAMPQANSKGSGDHTPQFPPHGSRAPRHTITLEQFTERLIHADRVGCRDLLRDFLSEGHDARDALERFIWPACAAIDRLSRQDQIAPVHEHGAIVLLAQLVQRLECGLSKHPARCREVVVTSGRAPIEELAAEIFAGIAEADGFDVVFFGGGVESDDLFAEVTRRRPACVVSFAAAGPDAPRLRRLIDAVRRQDPVPGLRIGVGGGVFERVPGLAEEIGADFFADNPFAMLDELRRAAMRPREGSEASRRSRAA